MKRHLAIAGFVLAGCAASNAFAAETALPLRTESIIGVDDVLRIAVVLVLLLAVTSAALWWYQRRFGRLPPGFSERKPEIDVIARQRLSARTQVFVIRRGAQEFLVTESPSGTTTLVIPPQ